MQITLTRRELIELYHGLTSLADLKGFKLGYAIARTKAKLRPEIEALEEAVKPDKEFSKYESKRLELVSQYAEKDENGRPRSDNGVYLFGDNLATFNAEVEKLREEYKEAIDSRQTQIEDYNSGLREKITVEVHELKEADIPGSPEHRTANPEYDGPEPSVAHMAVLAYLIAG